MGGGTIGTGINGSLDSVNPLSMLSTICDPHSYLKDIEFCNIPPGTCIYSPLVKSCSVFFICIEHTWEWVMLSEFCQDEQQHELLDRICSI